LFIVFREDGNWKGYRQIDIGLMRMIVKEAGAGGKKSGPPG
jgi:hypothetical protein